MSGYLGLVTSEHRNRPRFMATVAAVTDPLCGLQELLETMRAAFDVDSAVGGQLDRTGEWIGRSRHLRLELDGDIGLGAHRDLLRLVTQIGDLEHVGRGDLEFERAVHVGRNAPRTALDDDGSTRNSGSRLIQHLACQGKSPPPLAERASVRPCRFPARKGRDSRSIP